MTSSDLKVRPASRRVPTWTLATLAAMVPVALPALLPAAAQAQPAPFPNRPIKLLVPVAPGGGADAVARMVAERMSQSLGKTVVVENKAGGSGTIASVEVARADPDGYTLEQCYVATHSTNPAVLKLSYDPIADFAPVGMMGKTSNVLVVSSESPAKTLQEFLSLARSKPGVLNFSSAGAGSATHLIMEYLENQAKVDLAHIPYKGAAPALQDLLAGRVDAMFPSLTTALPHIKTGKLRALAVASEARDPAAPDVPTVAEQGFPGFSAIQWWGLCAPAKTPAPIVATLNKALVDALGQPAIKARFAEMAAEPTPISPAQFGAFMKEEVAKWAKLVKDTNLKVE